MDQPTEKATDPIQLRLEYVQVPSGRDDVTRYKAMKSSSAPDNNESISIQSWMELVSSNTPSGNQAASDLTKVISSSPYASLMFETPGTSWEYSRDTPFEFALVNEPALQRFAEGRPDRNAFQEHFRGCLGGNNNSGDGIVPMCCSFGNLGGDARLVAPLPSPSSSSDATYSHLAIFVRNAPKEQVGEFWRLGASQYLSMLEEKHDAKTWFSTNGMGVAWLHLRLDSVPKYYSYRPFTAR